MRRFLFVVLFALTLASCCSDPDFALTENATPRLEQDSKVLMQYDENLHQMAFNHWSSEFRMTTDDMTDYMIVDLEEMPSSAPSSVLVESLQWSCAEGIIARTGFKMDVVKMEDSKIWLWNSSDKLGLCISVLQ